MRSASGFTLLETILAIAICGVVLAALGSVSTSSLRHGRDGNLKIQATQILDTLGRRIAGGGDSSLLPSAGETLEIDYGELSTLVDIGEPMVDLYRVEVTSDGNLSVGDSSTIRYRIEVCYSSGDVERCVRGTTLGRKS